MQKPEDTAADRTEYAYTTGTPGMAHDTISYGYSDSEWSDLLISYDGQTRTNYETGKLLDNGIWQYTWEHGRQLAGMTVTAGNSLVYSYGTDGLRTEKTYTPANGTEYYERYYYSESALCYIVYTGGVMSFLYDANGGLLSTNVNGTNYIYLKNAQGDIIGLADRYGNVVVEYTYDAWGNILSVTGSLAGTLGQDNPFRYRSYCYDDETGLYYLGSRYYDPEVGRFINTDDIDILQLTQNELLVANHFACCKNNPNNSYLLLILLIGCRYSI